MNYSYYKKSRNASWQVLIDFKIDKLPINVVDIAYRSNINVLRNSETNYLQKDEDAISFLKDNVWYVIYDDTKAKERSRFTIAHELGHIFLGHELTNDKYNRTTFDYTKPTQEQEADIFASRLLAPACVLWGLDVKSSEEIQSYCKISKQAADIRFERMQELHKRNKFLTNNLEKQVYNLFKKFIDTNK